MAERAGGEMDEIDTLETEWLSYLLANSPWAYINMSCGRLKKMYWTWMNECTGEKGEGIARSRTYPAQKIGSI